MWPFPRTHIVAMFCKTLALLTIQDSWCDCGPGVFCRFDTVPSSSCAPLWGKLDDLYVWNSGGTCLDSLSFSSAISVIWNLNASFCRFYLTDIPKYCKISALFSPSYSFFLLSSRSKYKMAAQVRQWHQMTWHTETNSIKSTEAGMSQVPQGPQAEGTSVLQRLE